MAPTDVRAALDDAAVIGPYFAMDPVRAAPPPWRALSELTGDPAVLADRVDVVRDALAARTGLSPGAIDRRACASTHSLALLSRLVAPALATTVVAGLVPFVAPATTYWQPVDGGPVPLASTEARSTAVGDVAAAAEALAAQVIGSAVAALVEAFATVEHVSRTVLWGNVTSAAVGATTMLSRSDAELVLDPVAVVRRLVSDGPLRGTGGFDRPGRGFVRASCCLFYRIPNGGKCGDCILL